MSKQEELIGITEAIIWQSISVNKWCCPNMSGDKKGKCPYLEPPRCHAHWYQVLQDHIPEGENNEI